MFISRRRLYQSSTMPPDESYENDSERAGDSTLLPGLRPARRNTRLWRPWRCALALTCTALLAALAYFVLSSGVRSPPEKDQSHRSACYAYPEDCQTTAACIFDAVHSLLKQWPNTYANNGHSIVVASLPPHTPLYHARPSGGRSKAPTFFAFDAYVFQMPFAPHCFY